MKTCATATAVAASTLLLATLSLDSVSAMQSYLAKIPNGNTASFTQELGHSDATTYALTAFGTAFSEAGNTWTAELCKSTFPNADMTVGEAFGDPCCTWTAGGTPDFTVTAFTTSPTKKTVCASSSSSASSASTTTTPTTTTASPSSSSSSSTTTTPTTTTATPSTTTASPSASTSSKKKCGVKRSSNTTASSSDDDSGSDDA